MSDEDRYLTEGWVYYNPPERSTQMDDYSGAWRPVSKAEWDQLKARGEKVSWAEGVGLIVYDDQALAEFKEASARIAEGRRA